MTTTKPPSPPRHLSAASKGLWKSVVTGYDLAPHHLKLLVVACESLDTIEQARLFLAEHGLTYVDRFGAPHSRPEVAIQRDARLAYVRALRALDLDGDVEAKPHPDQGGGY